MGKRSTRLEERSIRGKPDAANDTKPAIDRDIADAFRRHLELTEAQFAAISAFANASPSERLTIARQIVLDVVINATESPDIRFSSVIAESESLLQGYATLDHPHREDIQRLIEQIRAYVRDPTRKRPFNALMVATPGAGKSHFIKQVAGAMSDERVRAVTFNMASMQSTGDMAQPVDELRNLKVNDQFPMLFLDEFDSDPTCYPSLLPLLWDGEFRIGHRDLRLGKTVIILAGSNQELPRAMRDSATMQLDGDGVSNRVADGRDGKLVDLLSRINGGIISIPDLDLRTETRDRRVDKVCITASLLRSRFGMELLRIPRSLLRFVAHTTFRYGVRSIAHLVDVIARDAFHDGTLDLALLRLPFETEDALQASSLKWHLCEMHTSRNISNRWREFSRDTLVVDLTRHVPWHLFAHVR